MPKLTETMNADDLIGEEPSDAEKTPVTQGEGYCIRFCVLPDGFSVSDPEPLPAVPEYQPQDPTAETVPDMTTAIKHLIHVIDKNPIGGDEQAGFDSAFKDES